MREGTEDVGNWFEHRTLSHRAAPRAFARASGGLWEDGELGTIHVPPGSQNPIRSTVVSVAWAPAAWTGKVSKLAVCPG